MVLMSIASPNFLCKSSTITEKYRNLFSIRKSHNYSGCSLNITPIVIIFAAQRTNLRPDKRHSFQRRKTLCPFEKRLGAILRKFMEDPKNITSNAISHLYPNNKSSRIIIRPLLYLWYYFCKSARRRIQNSENRTPNSKHIRILSVRRKH